MGLGPRAIVGLIAMTEQAADTNETNGLSESERYMFELVSDSWREVRKANKEGNDEGVTEKAEGAEGAVGAEVDPEETAEKKDDSKAKSNSKDSKGILGGLFGSRKASSSSSSGSSKGNSAGSAKGASAAATEDEGAKSNFEITQNFDEMMRINARLVGANLSWMEAVMKSMDVLVVTVEDKVALQQEADVLAIQIHKEAKGVVKLSEFQICLLASLRSLLPRRWDNKHEQAWIWMWTRVTEPLQKALAYPEKYEQSVVRFVSNMDEKEKRKLGIEVFTTMFSNSEGFEDFFKASNERLGFIFSRIVDMGRDIYREPVRLVDEAKGLGLRHIMYNVSVDFFPAFVKCCCDVCGKHTSDKMAIEGLGWSLNIIASVMTRAIVAGSSPILKAVIANSAKQVKKALADVPRGERARVCL